MKKKEQLTRSVAVTQTAYETLNRISQLTGLSLGQLTTNAIERTFDPRKNAELAAAMNSAKAQIVNTVS